ncbi:hypothetical protein H5410_062301 [Solanum commersonii]|uniref:DUF4371 domain-containing protein n=1 Tax=Solanum commersonii TaxID=4109 RepID=A0A9J5WB57_SOLCO|nr:hypothetical protein H5410_062301 [Solanum commersonii]
MQDLKNQRQSIQSSFDKQSEKARSDYRMRLNASIDVARFLLTSGFPFRGHDESEGSEYKGAFLELLKSYGDRSFDVGRVILDSLRQHQEDKLEELLKFGEVHTRQGLNQSVASNGQGDTRWGSHFKTLDNFLILFSSIVNVLKDMKRDCPYHLDRFAAENLLSKIHEFEFVFMLHLMFKVLLLTNELNKVLQKKDQDIVNAMGLLDLSKKRLQMMREDEWDSMMDEVSLFCGKHGISIPKMNEDYSNGKSKRKRSNISYLHHFRVEVFYAVIDLALQELNNRFDVVTSDLLLGMASLSPVDSFANFHKDRIMKLAEYCQVSLVKRASELNFQLDDFIVYGQKCDSKFLNLKGIKDLAKVMIETKLDQTWSLVYLLVKLTLIILLLHSVERAFSSMKYIKNDLRNRMDEDLLNGCLVCYIERSIFKNVSNDAIIDHFQNMKTRRGQL